MQRPAFTDVLKKIPPGQVGAARVTHDTPSRRDRLDGAIHGQPLYRDKYARLFVRNDLVMTDAEFERETNWEVLRRAKGDCLVAGLGLGLILDPLLKRCNTVTVVEKEVDVITLVGPAFSTCEIFCADICQWRPIKGQKFDTIYFDIWPHFNEDTAEEAAKLHQRFRKYLRLGGYMGSWCLAAQRKRRARR
jgi:hypothetical protein